MQTLFLRVKPAIQLKQVFYEQLLQGYLHFYLQIIEPFPVSVRVNPGTQREQPPLIQFAHPGEHLTH